MTAWRAISRGELDAMLADALANYDEAVREEWEAISIEPEKWKCSPWGDAGGGFWAVAIRGDEVLWYNDIEEGFNSSRFSVRGTIDEYLCEQDDFVDILERFAQTRADLAWLRLPAGDVPPELRGPGALARRQTTYCDLVADGGSMYRVHFKNKAEFVLSSGSYPAVELHTTHPLLADYEEPWASVYIADKARDSATVTNELDAELIELSDGWRKLADYENESVRARELLAAGHGLLLTGPAPVCAAAAAVLGQHGIRSSTLHGTRARGPMRVLVLGRDYVVASAFSFERRDL